MRSNLSWRLDSVQVRLPQLVLQLFERPDSNLSEIRRDTGQRVQLALRSCFGRVSGSSRATGFQLSIWSWASSFEMPYLS